MARGRRRPRQVAPLTGDEMLHIGLNLLGRYAVGNQRTNERRFRGALFGVGPEAVASVFHDLRTTDIQAARVPRANPKNLLLSSG